MSFTVTYGDALEYQGDAVLNSLGTNGAIYGKLCKNIIKGINRQEVKTLIDAQKNMPFGKIIDTEGGDLNCKRVLHIVTPFKKDDDIKCAKLHEAYKSVVDFAIEHGYKKIGLPIIGTGANGYSDKESYEALIDVLSDVSEEENKSGVDIVDATVIAYLNPVSICDEHKTSYRRMMNTRNNCVQYDFVGDSLPDSIDADLIDEHSFYKVVMFASNINPSDIFKPKMFIPGKNRYARPYEFVEDYMDQHKLPTKTIKEYDSHKRQKTRYNQTLSKIDVYRFSVLLNLNKTEIIQFMAYNGYTFNPTSRLDMFFMDYINGKYGKFGKLRKLYELDMLFMPTNDEAQFTV